MEGPFGYERIDSMSEGTNWRVFDAQDNRVATCHLEEHAEQVVALMNAGWKAVPHAAP